MRKKTSAKSVKAVDTRADRKERRMEANSLADVTSSKFNPSLNADFASIDEDNQSSGASSTSSGTKHERMMGKYPRSSETVPPREKGNGNSFLFRYDCD